MLGKSTFDKRRSPPNSDNVHPSQGFSAEQQKRYNLEYHLYNDNYVGYNIPTMAPNQPIARKAESTSRNC